MRRARLRLGAPLPGGSLIGVPHLIWALVVMLVGMPVRASGQTPPPAAANGEGELSPALRKVLSDSFRLLLLEHTTRIATQSKTRSALRGPFWEDYRRSVRVPRQWGDGDGWLVNYVGHPGHGAAAGFIWVNHDPRNPPPDEGFNSRYWRTRARATAWSATYSLQFEVGPFSEASIGNVGMKPGTAGWVDQVVTPLGAFGVMVAEDTLDRYLIGWLERRTANGVWRALARVGLNPTRAIANVAGARAPWYRDGRALILAPP